LIEEELEKVLLVLSFTLHKIKVQVIIPSKNQQTIFDDMVSERKGSANCPIFAQNIPKLAPSAALMKGTVAPRPHIT
jgi:hypothetical protein